MERQRYERLQTPTFAQTVVIIETMPRRDQTNRDAIIERHLALGFHYSTDQIYRAMDALNLRVRRWDHRNRRSGRST